MHANITRHTRDFHIQAVQEGNIVAFKLLDREGGVRMLTGKVEAITGNPTAPEGGTNSPTFTIRTKNGSVFYATREAVVWVKTGSRWPTGIYNALKHQKGIGGG